GLALSAGGLLSASGKRSAPVAADPSSNSAAGDHHHGLPSSPARALSSRRLAVVRDHAGSRLGNPASWLAGPRGSLPLCPLHRSVPRRGLGTGRSDRNKTPASLGDA